MDPLIVTLRTVHFIAVLSTGKKIVFAKGFAEIVTLRNEAELSLH
jgi:hypothetical protein